MREKEVRLEERARRAVEEISRSEEQLARVRETRRRKGEEASQIVKLRGGGIVQGSRVVGKFIDWRAVSCFGSRVDGEEREGFGCTVGDIAGDGAVEVPVQGSRRKSSGKTRACAALLGLPIDAETEEAEWKSWGRRLLRFGGGLGT